MKVQRAFRKLYWLISAKYYASKYPIDQSKDVFFGITGTDGKTTTSSFVYELAKSLDYSPLLLTTVSAKFQDKEIEVKLKSTSFFAYSLKNAFTGLKQFKLGMFFKNLLFLDKQGFDEVEEEHRTTPLASEIRKLIREYQTKGANFFMLETTSHALDQYRVYGIDFDSIAYTNITNDHLDYHGTYEHYAATKIKLIDQLKPQSYVAVNKDDAKSYALLQKAITKAGQSKLTYYVDHTNLFPQNKNFYIHVNQSTNEVFASSEAKVDSSISLKSGIQLFGSYNIYNALAAFTCFYGYLLKNDKNIPEAKLQTLASALANLEDIKGRMNFVHDEPTVIVDFAHTPNGTEQALKSAKELKEQKGSDSRLWAIFGCAGFRDHYKRPVIGKTAFEYADRILITADDPRTENLSEINDQIISGFGDTTIPYDIVSYSQNLTYNPAVEKLVVRFDERSADTRRNALAFALKNAQKNDVVIFLGKGHENTISIGTEEVPWDETAEIKNILG